MFGTWPFALRLFSPRGSEPQISSSRVTLRCRAIEARAGVSPKLTDSQTHIVLWAIGQARDYDDAVEQDQDDADDLFRLLEQEVIPTFQDRTAAVPHRWVAAMRRSIATCVPLFNTHRMVRDYVETLYFPAQARRKAAGASRGSLGVRSAS